ncbi:MAG: lipid A biosynthesis acyltransferase, partial [Xanthomonadales bacterium]|nr:lipid A biosynthesis acyltransferase [Xanthomonadales bacterium]
KQRKRIGRNSMTHYVRGVLEAGMLWHWPVERVMGHFDEPVGQDALDVAINDGKGLILAAPHCGAWEILNLYLMRYGMGAVLYKPGRLPEIDAALLEKRRRGGSQMVPATPAGLRTLFKLLKAGQSVALLPDQEPSRGEGQFAPFLGVEALTGVLLPRMARRTGVPVFFAVCARCKEGRYRVHLFRSDESIHSDDMRIALTAVNRGIEACINVDTEQYLWAYKRFRNRPEGEPSFYKNRD